MVYKKNKSLHIAVIFFAFIILALIASNFIYTNVRISSYALVMPKERWLITIGGNGQIISNLIDYSNGSTVQYNVTQFQRGEFVGMNFKNTISLRREFSKGDTVISMQSSDVKDQFLDAVNQLEISNAKLKSLSSPEKEPVVKEAHTRLSYIDEKIAEQKILVDRTQKLLEKGYASQQEYDLQKWNMDLLKIEKEIYSAQLENLKTGVKPEEIAYLRTEINSVESKLNFLKERESQLVITSPISGQIVTTFSPDTLLNVVNSREIVLQLPIKVANFKDFKVGQKMLLSMNNDENLFSGEVISIDKEVKIINQQQVVLVSVIADNSNIRILPGMVPEVTLKLKEMSLLQQLIRSFFH